jgi:DNA-binding sugar fermentation-stimulating protein
MDSYFTENIIKAEKKGVEVYAYTCEITLEGTEISRRIPINLE